MKSHMAPSCYCMCSVDTTQKKTGKKSMDRSVRIGKSTQTLVFLPLHTPPLEKLIDQWLTKRTKNCKGFLQKGFLSKYQDLNFNKHIFTTNGMFSLALQTEPTSKMWKQRGGDLP